VGTNAPRFFGPDVAVANHAESGESLRRSSRAPAREDLRPHQAGDYLFLQFAHNDQNSGPTPGPTSRLSARSSPARGARAIPVLVTSMQRRRFDSRGAVVNSLEGFPDAMRAVAKTEGVPIVDLESMSRRFYEALGPEGSKRAFGTTR